MLTKKVESAPFFLIIGAPNAGKTSLLYRLYSGIYYPEIQLTLRDFEELKVDKARLRSLNILENNLHKEEWEKFASGCSAVIFIVDTSTNDGILIGQKLFQEIILVNSVQNIPIAIFANKSDLRLYNKLHLEQNLMVPGIQSNPERIEIFNVSVKTSEGIIIGMEWIMKKSNVHFYIPSFRK
ncbi:MAG: ADP-ribosylation factor-like protein [Candidatus Hodarchaeota archaeon]